MFRGTRHQTLLGRFAALSGSALILSSMLLTIGVTAVQALDSGAKTAGATVAPNTWTTPDKATGNDGVYATARPANSGTLSQGYSTFGFGVPNGSIIDGITVSIEAKSSDSSGCQLEVRLSGDGGSTLRTKTISLTGVDAVYTLGSATDTWGQVWDPTQLTTTNFRVQLRALDGGSGCNDADVNNDQATASVDNFNVLVTYRTMDQHTNNAALTGTVCKSGDFNFVIDMSGSIGVQGNLPSNLQQLKDGINGFVNAFQGAGGDGRYAGTKFSGSSATTITSGYQAFGTFQTAVNALSGPSGLTPTSTGINTGAGNNAGDRAGSPNVMFVLTDGSPNKPNTHSDDLNNPETWLQGANGAVGAANAARAAGYIVKAVYLSTPQDPGDTSLPFSNAGDSAWAVSVMDQIGGGDHLDSDFNSFVNDLFAAIECPPPPPAHLTIAKTANPVGPVAVGSQIGFDITISNTGQGAATDVTIHDALPAGAALDWSLSPAFAGCSISGAVGSEVLDCSFASLGAGASKGPIHLVSGTAKGECGTIDNSATVDASNDDPVSDGASVGVKCPDITVTKTPDGGSVNAGSNAVFTIVVSNVGSAAATNVVLSDALPVGYTWTAGGADGASCSINTVPSPDVLTCTFATIAASASKTVTLTAPTSGQDCAVIPNTASATASNEVAGNNNSDSASINVLCASVHITKTANPAGPVSAGADIGFDITVNNSGDGAATAVHVTDSLPTGIAWTADATTGSASATCAIASGTLTCDAASMASGSNFKVHIHGTTDAADCGVVSNTATVSSGNDGGGTTPVASVTVECPDVKVTKTPDGGLVNAGDPITWTIKVENIGQGTAKGVILTDPLPAGITWTTSDAGCSITAGTLTCNVGDLTAGASKTYTVTGTTSKSDCGGPIDNTATATATNEPQDKLANNSNGGSVTVQCADIHIAKVANPAGPVDAGDPIGFDITVSNAGTGTAKNVTIHDDLPAAGGLDWSLSPAFSGCAISGAVGHQDLDCTFASLAPAASKGPIHLVSKTSASDCGTVSNTASAGSGNDGGDQATATVIVQCPSISILKTAIADSISAGELASFKIVVHNAGPGSAKDVTISDTLPGAIDWTVDDTAHCGIVTGVLTCTFDSVASGEDVTVIVSGETGVEDCGQLQNTATVAASNEGDGQPQIALDSVDTHSSSATILVNCATVVITKTADDMDIVNGDQIGFTITIKNNGAGTAFGVTASDPLPAGFAWAISPASTGWSIDAGVLKFGPLPLAANGGTTSVHIQAPTTAADCGIVENTASFSYAGGQDSDTSDVTVRCPSVDLDKTTTDADGKVEPGQTVSYGITVSVTDGPVTDAVVTDSLPVGQTYVAGSQSSTPAAASFTVSPDGRTLTWTYDSLDTGLLAASISYDAKIDADASTAPQTNEAQVCVAEEVVDCASDEVVVIPQKPSITIVKTAGDAADGAVLSTEPGMVTYTYVVTNDGPLALYDIVVSDDNGTPGVLGDDFEATCPATSLAPAEAMTCTWTVAVTVDTTNLATVHGVTVGGNAATDQDDAVVDVLHHRLTISKSNDAPIETLDLPDGSTADLPTADEGDTVAFTLTYAFSGDPVSHGVITDVLPGGLQYVDGSATSNSEFTFIGYDATTRTLSWTAATVTDGGALTYQALVLTDASKLSQPLTNTATIHSDQTEPDSDTSDVFVPTIPAGETHNPTPPPTDTLAPTGPSAPGSSLLLFLAGLGVLVLGIGFITPVPAVVKRRNRR